MPPKKKNRQQTSDESPEENSRPSTGTRSEGANPWTDVQEGLLLKNMISLKPVGIHKHFRVMAISESFQRHGHSLSEEAHLRPDGIWRKLDSLYNLEGLDEIEYAASLNLHKNEAADQQPFCDFELGPEEFGESMFARRIDTTRPPSPLLLPYQLASDDSQAKRRQSTMEETDEPRSSPASNRGRGTRARGKRTSRMAEAARNAQRGKGTSAEDSAEEDEDEADEMGSLEKSGMTGSKRRSGRNR